MASSAEQKFPTFECIISETQEDMDSEVENFFLKKSQVGLELARLKLKDPEWSENYDKMMLYLQDLSDALVEFKEAPSHQFLIDLCMGEELEGDILTTARATKDERVLDLFDTALQVREVIFWYVRNSKVSRFSKSFNPSRYQGLPFLRLALIYRGVNLSGQK